MRIYYKKKFWAGVGALLLGLALGTLATRLRLPSLVGMLLAGILLGPCVLNLLSPSLLGISADLRQLALVIILTRAGLSLERVIM